VKLSNLLHRFWRSIAQLQNYPITQSLPFSGFHQLADLALHQVAFQRADVADVELAVQVFDLMHKGASKQFFSFFASSLVPLSVHVLGTNSHFARPSHRLAKFGDAEAAFRLRVFALGVENLWIHQHQLGIGVFLEGNINDREWASYIDSNMSSTSFFNSRSKTVTGSAGFSKTGFPNFTMG
jgi:hypothetical protein